MDEDSILRINREAAKDIIKAYEVFIESGICDDSSKLAEYAYLKHFGVVSYLTDAIYEAKLKLFPIAYPNSEVSVEKPTFSEASLIIEQLRKV